MTAHLSQIAAILLCIVVPIAAITLVFVAFSRDTKAKASRLQTAQEVYQTTLNVLRADPSNADVRQRAIAAGTDYLTLAREQVGVVFDEATLMADIDAAVTLAPVEEQPMEEQLNQRHVGVALEGL